MQYFTEEMDLNLRFYVSILQSYMEYLNTEKNQNKELIKEWQCNIKPFLYKKYPFVQSGIFSLNADVKLLMEEIEALIKKSKDNDNIYIKKNIRQNCNINRNKEREKEKEKEEDDLSPLKINCLNIEKEQEKYYTNTNPNLNLNINTIKLDNIEEEEENNINNINDINNINIKVNKSSSIASKSTSVSIYDEFNYKDNIKDNYLTEINQKTRSFILNKEINPNFIEEFETERVTIVHKIKDKNIISKMTFNLFLKKIVISNFYNDNIIYATNFAEQCFYFIKKEIIFKKIMSCFHYYTQLKVPFVQRKNLIYFMNLLIIKMYSHYTTINQKDEIILLIKDFYNNVISEIKQNINKSKKPGEIIQHFFVEGINAIKQGVNNINKNIMDNLLEKKKKIIKNNNNESNNKINNNTEKEDLKQKSNNNKKKDKKNTNNVINIAENKIFYSELNIISPKKKTSDFVENHFEEDDKNKESLINSLISSILDVESLNESNKKPFKEKEYNFSPKILSFIQKGEEFISLINSFNFDKITGMNNYLIMISNYKNDKSLEKCLMTAKKDYYNLIDFLKCFKDTNLLSDKNNVSLKKQECSLLICKIIKELSQFLVDYNFVIELVNSNKYNTYSRMLKKIKKLDKDNVLNQDNVNVIKLIMEKELENEAI